MARSGGLHSAGTAPWLPFGAHFGLDQLIAFKNEL